MQRTSVLVSFFTFLIASLLLSQSSAFTQIFIGPKKDAQAFLFFRKDEKKD
jgi:hypothetical protein